jgi:hypothetical protein
MEKATEINEIVFRFEHDILQPYELPGNRMSRELYTNLPLPWQVDPPVSSFPESDFVRHEYDKDGVFSNGESFFGGDLTANVRQIEKGLATSSMVMRWREAHSDLAGTEKDCLRVFIEELREVLGGKDEIVSGSPTVILLFKKT